MLFNSYEFIFGFMPLMLAVLYLLTWRGHVHLAVWATALGSLVFYALGNVNFVPLLVASVVTNYWIGTRIVAAGRGIGGERFRKYWLLTGVSLNLATLGYFKYMNFFLDNVALVTGWPNTLQRVVLPVGISFFTFTQIAYLVDCGRGEGRRYSFADYLLFVTFFPHLVAGPILNHKSIIPQLESRAFGRPGAPEIYAALTFFSIGLFKKVVIADSLAPQVKAVFEHADISGFVEAWTGALLYTFQLYYDFSGYSEMAVGLALLMNVRIPINFNSPYKATSIIDFWRRWHISLSNFLRDYLYIPLGGNRLGERRRYFNLLATMLLGGIWHGAGWTFLMWGALHGAGLAVNHAWRGFGLRLPTAVSWPLTFLVVVIAWVVFRAPDVGSALSMLAAMTGMRGLPSLDTIMGARPLGTLLDVGISWAWIVVLGAWSALAPNTQEMILTPAPRPAFAAVCALIFVAAVMSLDRATEFLYFQF